jgi:RHS repeat-associated protein
MNMAATHSIVPRLGSNRYAPGAGIDERVAQIDANGVVTFMHNDKQHPKRAIALRATLARGVIAISDSVGNPVVRRGYGTYGGEVDKGEVRGTSTPPNDPAQMVGTTSAGTSAHPFGYTGRRWDPDLGLYYYRARWYDPQLGTFLETDPIGSLDYVNLYAYVGLEPGNATDPTGMQAVFVAGGAEVVNRRTDPMADIVPRRGVSSPATATAAREFMAAHPGVPTIVVSHSEANSPATIAAITAARQGNPSMPLTIMGFSWGGPEAAALSGRLGALGIKTDLLVSADSVGHLSAINRAAASSSSSQWIAVTSRSINGVADPIARAGGRTPFSMNGGVTRNGPDGIAQTGIEHADLNGFLNTPVATPDGSGSANQRLNDIWGPR